MRHNPLHGGRFFFSTSPLPCPYLDGRNERRVVTELTGRDAKAQNNALTRAGYRRSHSIVYAPACPDCDACRAVRINVGGFHWTKSWRRVINQNRSLEVIITSAKATDEQYELFSRYQDSRHAGGDMANMDVSDYRSLVEDTCVDTFVSEFRTPGGELAAVCLADQLDDGLSAVYSFFDHDLTRNSLGSYMILWLVRQAEMRGLDYVYLGFWIPDCEKMSYKARFQPLETYTPSGWKSFKS